MVNMVIIAAPRPRAGTLDRGATGKDRGAITGSMVSIVRLRFPDGSTAHLEETVPFRAVGQDNGTPRAGVDRFGLSVLYTATPGLDQADLFGSPATFAGTLATGNIVVQ